LSDGTVGPAALRIREIAAGRAPQSRVYVARKGEVMNIAVPSVAVSVVLLLGLIPSAGKAVAQESTGSAALSVSAALTEALSNNPEINAA